MKSPLASRAKTAVGDGDAVGGPVSRHLRRLARHSLTRSQLGLVHTCDHRSLRRHGSDELRIRRNLTRFDEPSESPRLGRARGFFVLTAVMLAACPTTDDRSNHRWSGMRRAGGDFSYRALLMDAITSSISAKSIEPLSRSLPAKGHDEPPIVLDAGSEPSHPASANRPWRARRFPGGAAPDCRPNHNPSHHGSGARPRLPVTLRSGSGKANKDGLLSSEVGSVGAVYIEANSLERTFVLDLPMNSADRTIVARLIFMPCHHAATIWPASW